MSAIQETPKKNFYVHRGAPDPIIVRFRAGGPDGTLVAFDSTIKFQYVNASGTVTLGVGSGITLSADETIADARATIQLSVAQSRQIPKGAVTKFEIQRSVSGREEVFLMGNLIGAGGDNPDAA
jgi:hypothetical protein